MSHKGKSTLLRGPMPILCFRVGPTRRVTLVFDCRPKCAHFAPDEWGRCTHKQNRYCTHVEARAHATQGLIALANETLKELRP